MEKKIKDFIEQRVGSDIALRTEDDIFEMGLVNSMFALQLITFLENEFKIAIQNEDLDIKNFNSVDSILKFLNTKPCS